MSELSSFYGGRQGASFVIVKRFDGINIPQPGDGSGVTEYTYTVDSYAVSADGSTYLLVTQAEGGNVAIDADNDIYLISRNKTNYTDYKWQKHLNNGGQINSSNYNFPRKLAEGMVQCFAKGAQSSSEVNYGEYVLIDTIYNNHDLMDPDNGKVFRRGMSLESELAGAEYIGQIVGPQGETPQVEMGQYSTIAGRPNASTGAYNMTSGVVPGRRADGTFNDEINYAYVTLYDDYNNVQGCLIGFQFPYLVEEFYTVLRSPYDDNGVPLPDTENIITRVDDRTHPYYERWQLSIPRGIQGDDLSQLKIYPTRVRAGVSYWNDASFSGDPAGQFTQVYDVRTVTDDYITVSLGNRVVYVKPEDGWGLRIKYTITSYKEQEAGISQEIDIGKYDVVSGLNLSEEGILTIFYTNSEDEISDTVIKWIEPDKGGFIFTDDGSIEINYNTGYKETFEDLLTWIKKVTLSPIGDFDILYNNNEISASGGNSDHWHLQWVNDVTIDQYGNVDFIYNDGEIAKHYNGLIKTIKNVYIDTDGTAGIEGFGDQKVHIEYNTRDTSTIGRPLNYIIESVISDTSASAYGTEPYHLLVLYSDPDKRNKITNPKTYYSKVLGRNIDKWADLGYVRGVPGGLHIITDVLSETDLYDSTTGNAIKPEDILGTHNPEQAGWAVTVTPTGESSKIYVFDYDKELWYSIGSIDSSMVDAARIFTISGNEPTDMSNGGTWAKLETIKYAN